MSTAQKKADSGSCTPTKNLHLVFAGEGEWETEGVRSTYAVRPTPVAHRKAISNLCMSEKASSPWGKRQRNKNRDARSNRHPRGRTYCSSSAFNPSRPRNEHPAGVRLLAWGEHPPIRTCKRGRGMNRQILHVWLKRHADGLTRRHCDAYEPAYRRKEASSRN